MKTAILMQAAGMKTLALAGLALICLYPSGAEAACFFTPTPTTVDFGSVSVPRDAAVGAAIGPARISSIFVTCGAEPSLGAQLLSESIHTLAAGVATTWTSNYPGLGYRVTSIDYGNRIISDRGPGGLTPFGPNTNASGTTITLRLSYQLIKIGTISNGSLSMPSSIKLISRNLTTTGTTGSYTGITLTASFTAVTCSVTTKSIAVTLPNAPVSSMPAIGNSTGNTGFNIGLSCNPGSQVYMTLTDSTNPGNTSNQLSLAPGSTASGVTLQILKSGTPVSFGPDSATAGNTNQFLIGPSDSTSSIPLSVRYYRSGALTAGSVKGLATFIMSYQ